MDAATASCDVLDKNARPIIFDSTPVTTVGVEILAQRIHQAGWFE